MYTIDKTELILKHKGFSKQKSVNNKVNSNNNRYFSGLFTYPDYDSDYSTIFADENIEIDDSNKVINISFLVLEETADIRILNDINNHLLGVSKSVSSLDEYNGYTVNNIGGECQKSSLLDDLIYLLFWVVPCMGIIFLIFYLVGII